jgi:carboxyl-terminal processing protease
VRSVLAAVGCRRHGLDFGPCFREAFELFGGQIEVVQVVGKIRGEVGTEVKLGLVRGDEQKTISVTRRQVTAPTVEQEIIGKTGILTVHMFNDDTGRLARAAAEQFVAQGVDKVILDLRGNGGGTVTAAQALAGLWLDNQPLMTERRGGKIDKTIKTTGKPLLGDKKTIVLINGGSASASEIVAGALSEYDKATLVGEKSYGKGSVQAMVQLSDGSMLKVTTARWYTPKGATIDGKGIDPSIEVKLTAEDFDAGRDPQLEKAKEL